MTREDIIGRLEHPQPLRQGEVAEMTGYTVTTLRRMISEGTVGHVSLPGTTQKRIPVDEARRLLVGLRVIPEETKAQSARSESTPLRMVRA